MSPATPSITKRSRIEQTPKFENENGKSDRGRKEVD
jgi:hypothetical protein